MVEFLNESSLIHREPTTNGKRVQFQIKDNKKPETLK